MRRTSILDGIDVATLQTRLVALQQAYFDLTSGGKTQTAAYSQGDGSKSVTYTAANIGDLTQAIITLQTQIDRLQGVCINRRAPLRPVF
jgi:hypothetical protein